ncbi:MAG TPA: malonyl-ACP O-methyltransferase BioC [Burkholderiales bacterium]|nr:malonyl-ACP O-methyltransferase BioC [Burkholderiales bacterium]
MNDVYLLERGSLRQSFDQAAATYDSAASLQRKAAKHLLSKLDRSLSPQVALDLGCGTGHAGTLFVQRFPLTRFLYTDLAFSMARQAAEGGLAICADANALPFADACVDLLWSNLMMQWCNDLPHTFAQMHAVCRPGATLAFSTFGPATLQELRNSFDDGYTHVNRFVAAHEIEAQLETAGFAGVQLESQRRVVHYAEVLVLMRELKFLGANNATSGRARGLTGRHRWRQMIARYERLRSGAGLPATYELIFVIARKRN